MTTIADTTDSPDTTKTAGERVPREARPPLPRDPFFDNAKFLAIVLVVIGHAWEPLKDGSHTMRSAYLFVYTFHMPVFIFMAGYFSRRFTTGSNKAQKLVAGVVVPYLLFDAAYAAFRTVAADETFVLSSLAPYWITWFLAALLFWRLSTPVWQRIRWPLLVAVAISLLAGTQDVPQQLALSRTLGFLPFFVLGLTVKDEHLRLLRKPWARVAGAGVLICAMATAYVAGPHMSGEWIYYRESYEALNVSPLVGIAMRLAMLCCGTLASAAFLSLVPSRRTVFTALGATTMYVYVLHGFFVHGASYAGLYDIPGVVTPLGAILVTLACVPLAFALASPPVRATLRWAVEPRLNWLFKRRPKTGATPEPQRP